MLSSEALQTIDRFIKESKLFEARKAIRGIKTSEISRPQMGTFGNLARRAGLPQISVRILNPIVRPKAPLVQPATEMEMAEYASALVQIGARQEALSILQNLNVQRNSEVLLFQAFAHFSGWNYAEAIPLLEKYVSVQTDEYRKLVGQVNLGAAYVFEARRGVATQILRRAGAAAKKMGALRLLANTLELQAQLHIQSEEYSKAQFNLDEASKLLTGSSALDGFFVFKWRTLLGASGKRTKSKVEAIKALRSEALSRNHWETLRDCDFYLARFTGDRDLFARLHFGTPFESFKRRIERVMGEQKLTLPEKYVWCPGQQKNPSLLFYLVEGHGSNGSKMKVGQSNHRLLTILSQDFYRPVRSALLHALLFPNDYYNPYSSPHRVHQSVHRLLEWFEEARLPFTVDRGPGGYNLRSLGSVGLVLTAGVSTKSRLDLALSAIRRGFGTKPFRTQDFMSVNGMSKRTALRFLEEGKLKNQLEIVAAGRSTRYRLKD